MKVASQTKIFSLNTSINPKLWAGALLAVAGFLFWHNSQGEAGGIANKSSLAQTSGHQLLTAKELRARANGSRRPHTSTDRNSFRLRSVDPMRGDVDPTIRLDLLTKVRSINEPLDGRSLFEIEVKVPRPVATKIDGPVIMPEPIPIAPALSRPVTIPLQVSIPLKYYGYVHSQDTAENSRGLFLDGDHVLVAAKGEFVKGRYLVVELTQLAARMEDTQVKLQQVLAVATP